MFVLKKLFKLRENGGSSANTEKPFLEHLEDLRDVIIKVVITLLIATIACYIFRSTLMDVLRRPIEQVWIQQQEQKLPPAISPDLWEQAKKAADATSGLSPEQKVIFFDQFENKQLHHYAQTASYYRASLLIADLEKRQSFVENLPQVDEKTKTLLTTLLSEEMMPSAATNAKGDVVFMRSLKPTETFMLAIKLSVFAGIIISFPFLLYFILQFVLPGLKENERKALWPALLIGFGLFLLGVFFCYFTVLPKALDFFYTYSGGMGVENEWRIGDYITFTTQFTLIFGLSFELPVVVMTLVKLGLLSYQTMSNTRSYAILTIFVVGAIITPTGDALTLSLLAVPMCVLYEICIWLAYFNQKKELEAEAEEEAEIQEYVDRQKEASTPPVPVPVPGRISTQDDGYDHDYADEHFDDDHYGEDHFDEHDYDEHDEHDDEYFHQDPSDDADEGEEMDDGEIEDFSKTTKSDEEPPTPPTPLDPAMENALEETDTSHHDDDEQSQEEQPADDNKEAGEDKEKKDKEDNNQ
ncbi:MAG: twin-arginine translocase subunit TatC [Akkermansiaceae bacterium]